MTIDFDNPTVKTRSNPLADAALALDLHTTELTAAVAAFSKADLAGVACADLVFEHLQAWLRRLYQRMDWFEGAYPDGDSTREDLEAYGRFILCLCDQVREDRRWFAFGNLYGCHAWMVFAQPHWMRLLSASDALQSGTAVAGENPTPLDILTDALLRHCTRQRDRQATRQVAARGWYC